jgi:hypothetical protein
MELSPEQCAADDAVMDAIDHQHRAYYDETEAVITKYIVVAQRQGIDEDGDFVSRVYATMCDGMSLADALGLSEFASTQFRKMITED